MIEFFITVLAGAIYAIAVGFVARRVLGVPIGWLRTFTVGFVIFVASSPIATFVAKSSGLVISDIEFTPQLMTAGAIVLLAFVWTFAIGVSVLVALEIVFPTGSVPNPIQAAQDWAARRRRTRRYLSILAILSKHGLGRFLRGRTPPTSGPQEDRTATALVNALNDAGVTFIKIGQMLSTRRDLLSDSYIQALSQLQNNAKPEDWSAIRSVIEKELRRPISEVFSTIDEEPLASASVAQVHCATLHDGTEVVVKVQRPGARAQVVADIDILKRLAAWLEARTEWGRSLQVVHLADGFAKTLFEELDYQIERRNMEMIQNTSKPRGSDEITTVIPQVFSEYSTQSLLVMERLHGTPLSDAEAELSEMSPAERNALALTISETVLRNIMVHGVFHADLHPGNLLIIDRTTIGYLDFGSVGILDRDTREKLAAFLLAIARDDNVATTDTILSLVDWPEDLDQRGLQREIGMVLTALKFQNDTEVSTFITLFGIARNYNLGIPANVAIAFRALATLDGGLRLISPGFDISSQAQTIGSRIALELYSREAVLGSLQTQFASYLSFGKRLPGRLEKIASDLESDSFFKRFRPFANPEDRAYLSTLAYDALGALLAVAAVIGAIVLIDSDSGPFMTPSMRLHTFLGYILAVLGFMLALRATLRVFLGRNRR